MTFDRPVLRLLIDCCESPFPGVGAANSRLACALIRSLLHQAGSSVKAIFVVTPESHAWVRAQLVRLQDEVLCVSPGAEGAAFDESDLRPNEKVWREPLLGLGLRVKADVIYAPGRPASFLRGGVPLVGVAWDEGGATPPSWEDVAADLRLGAALIQCSSARLAAALRERFGIPAERLFVVPVAAPPDRFGPPTGNGECPAAFLYPAEPDVEANYEGLLVAYRIYRHRAIASGNPLWRLLLGAAEHARTPELRALARVLGVSSHVRFDPGPRDLLWPKAGAVIFPALQAPPETMLIEAAQRGVPVAASAPSAAGEGGGSWLTIDPQRPDLLAGALTRLAEDPGLRAELRAGSAVYLGECSPARGGARLLERLRAAAALPRIPFVLGIHGDGWVENHAFVGLPPLASRCRLEIRTQALPQPRYLIARAGDLAYGSYDLPAGVPGLIAFDLYPGTQPLHLRVPDAAGLAPQSDPRRHGVCCALVRLIPEGLPPLDLFSLE